MGRISRMLHVVGKAGNKTTVVDKAPTPTDADLVQALRNNPNLMRIVTSWRDLPLPVKNAILVLLDTAK
mgnify:CR=1 FL=1|jgi:hypothetical protein